MLQEIKNPANYLLRTTILVSTLHFLATKLYWYNDFFWFDMLMHFIGGIFIGFIALYILYRFKISQNKKFISTIKITILTVFVVGLFWEVYEYVVQGFTGAILANPIDSISDLFFDLAGGLYAVYIFQKQNVTIDLWNKKN